MAVLIAHDQGFGPTEEDVRRFQEHQHEVTVLETKRDRLANTAPDER